MQQLDCTDAIYYGTSVVSVLTVNANQTSNVNLQIRNEVDDIVNGL